MSHEFTVEYALSSRAGCKACKSKIAKGSLRIGTISPGPGDYNQTQWRHLECQKLTKHLKSVDDIQNLDVIAEEVHPRYSHPAHSTLRRRRAPHSCL